MAKNGNEFKGNGLKSLAQIEGVLKEGIAKRDAGRAAGKPPKTPLTPEEKRTRLKVGGATSKAPQYAPVAPTSVDGAVGVVRSRKTGEVISVPTKEERGAVSAPVVSEAVEGYKPEGYDELIAGYAKKPLPTDRGPENTPENIQAFEGSMLVLIPKIAATAGFHERLRLTQNEDNRLNALESASRKAKREGKDVVEFEFNKKKETFSLQQARATIQEGRTKLDETRGDLQTRADELLKDRKIWDTADKLRAKTIEKISPTLDTLRDNAQTEEARMEIERDMSAIEDALSYAQTFKPNGGLASLGTEKRARLANTHSAITEIYKKYGIKPATEDDLKTVKPLAPKVVAPEPVVPEAKPEMPDAAVAPATLAPSIKTKKKIVPSMPKVKKVSASKEYVPKNGRKMREGDLNAPEKEIGHREMIGSDINYQDVENGPREMIADDLNVPEKSKEYGPREMVAGDLEHSEYGEAGTDKMPNTPGKPWVQMTEADLGLNAPLVANPENAIALSQEQIARIEAYREAIAKQGERINTEAEKKGFGATMNKVASWYNKQPMWKKVGMGLTFTTVGIGGMMVGGAVGGTIAGVAFGTGRALGTFGTWAMLNGATSRMKSREAAGLIQGVGTAAAFFLLPKLAQYIDMQTGAGQWLANKFGLVQTPAGTLTIDPPVDTPPPTIESYMNIPPPIDVPPPTPSEFGVYNPPIAENPPEVTRESFRAPAGSASAITIVKGDTTWGVVEKSLNARPEFSGLDRAGKDLAIDTYMKKLGGMTPEQLKALGFSSGNINKIQIGEVLKLPVLEDQALFDKAITDANNLSPEQKANILKYNAGTISGGGDTAAYVPPAPEASVSLETNVTANYKNSLEYIFGNRQDRYKNFVSWKNPDYFINASNYTPDVLRHETSMQGVEIERLRDTLSQYKKAGLTGRTVEQLLQAGARSKAGL